MSDKKALIANALLEGLDPRACLIDSGISPASADYEIARLEKDPMAIALRRAGRRLQKRDWTLQTIGRLAATRIGGIRVDVLNRPEPEHFFEHYYAANRPALLRKTVDHWPALDRWSLDYLDEIVGDATIQVQVGRDHAHSELDKASLCRSMTMRAVTSAIRSVEMSNDLYVTAYDSAANREALAPLWADLGKVAILREDCANEGYFWLGPKGTLTPFHHDLTNNLLVQVVGRKKVLLVPAWEVGRMRNTIHCYSSLEPSNWQDGAVPGNMPPRLEVVIEPGDALFLPVGWWHHVEALDHSISMSFTSFCAENDFYSDYQSYGIF